MTIPKKAGIYKLICNKNGKSYIGKSINILRRIKEHKNSKADNILQRAVLKYGWDSFDVEILEIVENFDKLTDNDSLLDKEAYYIELFDTTNRENGYNICKFSTDKTGVPCSAETKEKLRQAHLGKILDEEHKEKIRQARIGFKHSDEDKENMRQAHLGYKQSDEHKEKIRQAHLGFKHSDESKEKMREVWTEEAKEKLRSSRLGKPRSEETKEKIRQSKLGKKFSEEHKSHMRKPKVNRNTADS